ncbi:hypothetical protein SBOR_3886 [Sclerotinia borealis F-4128]|uniref:Uncharacterized protein n=1 Tax=Sclerotinia borealis (strain F-4128) TaxID=1432307 RepID=W9CG61_SCLBF|nr:hypothetical protein SBOR_3886 [Sclerotinia borealis F-4128]
MGIFLSDAHTFTEPRAALISNKYSHISRPFKAELYNKVKVLTSIDLKRPSTDTPTSSFLPSIQNIAFLTTLSALGIYTPAVIGIGIMTSHVQASSFPASGGLSSSPRWKSSPIDHKRRRRAHPRDVSVAGPDTQDKYSYHVAEVLVKKFEELLGRVNGQYPRFKSPGHLPKFATLGRENENKGESADAPSCDSSTNSENQLTPAKSGLHPRTSDFDTANNNTCHTTDLKIRQNDNTLQPTKDALVSRDLKTRQNDKTLQSEVTSLVRRDPEFSQFWQNLIHLCWGPGMHWNGNGCGSD